MPMLARYRIDTGAITGVWESTDPDSLVANMQEDDPGHGYVFAQSTVSPGVLQERYAVQEGVLTEKAQLTITATPNPFRADGQEVCVITVVPFVPCVLLAAGVPYSLVDEDRTLEVTSAVPNAVHVILQPMAAYWAAELVVEAR